VTDRSFSEKNQRIVEKLKIWGMTEYESKIYTTLVMLQVGGARDIHELTGIPRGRVYEILADLTKKGYIGVIQGNPIRYRVLDISRTFERIKKDTLDSIDEIRQMLEEMEKAAKPATAPGYVVQSESAIDNQVNAILKQTKEAVLILCNDPSFLKKYRKELKCAHSKLDLRVVVENPGEYSGTDFRLYRCDPLMKKSLVDEKFYGDHSARILFAIFADYREDVIIIRRGSSLEGLFSSEFVITEYLQRSMMERIEKA